MPVIPVDDHSAENLKQKALLATQKKAPPRVYRLLSWMADSTIADPKFATSALEIYIRFFKLPGDEALPEDWKRSMEETLPKNWKTWRKSLQSATPMTTMLVFS